MSSFSAEAGRWMIYSCNESACISKTLDYFVHLAGRDLVHERLLQASNWFGIGGIMGIRRAHVDTLVVVVVVSERLASTKKRVERRVRMLGAGEAGSLSA